MYIILYIIICKPLFLLGWPLSEGLSFGSEVGCGGPGGVVFMDEPSSVGGDALLLLHKYSYNNSYNLWHTYFQCDEW